MGRMRVKPGECIGSGGIPMPPSVQFEEDGSTTGICAGCKERVTLDADGFVPPHKQPGPTREPSL